MPRTYEPIATQTLGSTATSITFTSIPSTYTDLVLICASRDSRPSASADGIGLTFNTDTSTSSTNYSFTVLTGNGSSASSSRGTNQRHIDLIYTGGTTSPANSLAICIANIMNYANTTTFKTVLNRGGETSSEVATRVGMWRNTAAVNTLTLYPGFNGSGYTFSTGSTFTLYGIKAA